jgi:signal transduction histidine kinase
MSGVGPWAVGPVVVTVGCVVVVAVLGRRRAAWPAGVAAAFSLLTTAASLWLRPHYAEIAGTVAFAECAALAVLTAVVARWSPRRAAPAVAAACWLAAALCVLRFLPDVSVVATVGACALWGAGPAVAVVVGGYPRLSEERRIQAVAAARRAQQVALARDIHDFVAHDVSGIVVQAQSARFSGDPVELMRALERIEAAGLQALAVLDRTVHTLRADGVPLGLADLPALVDRFEGTARLDLAELSDVPRDVGATAYRVVSESLTNVRRHAAAESVHVSVRLSAGPALTVTVINERPGARRPPRSRAGGGGGSGLAALRERVDLLGGTFAAGPHRGGWRVAAVLPWRPAS